jgi:hypothetical protein
MNVRITMLQCQIRNYLTFSPFLMHCICTLNFTEKIIAGKVNLRENCRRFYEQ